jgi:hypothetical protein
VLGVVVIAAAASGGIGLHALSGGAPDAAMAAATSAPVQVTAVPLPEIQADRTAAQASRSLERAVLRARLRAKQLATREARTQRIRLSACDHADQVFAGLGLDREQRANLQIIVDLARRLGLPPRAAVIAAATAWQESRLRNLDHGLGDSVGMFQQRPSMGWGSVAQLQDPRYATRRFYERLVEVRGWQQLTIGDAAQAVQRSAYPQRYARWTSMAADGVRGIERLRSVGVTC